MCEKKIVIIAGPNGAGKTTFAQEYLPNEAECPSFINADLIAYGLSPFQPEKVAVRAGKFMLNEIDFCVRHKKSFAFETTLSARIYSRKIPTWRKNGYQVKLIYLSLPDVELALARVAARVTQGGHQIPEDIVRRRYREGWNNFQMLYKPIVDVWAHYDNSGQRPVLVDQGENK